MEGQYFEACNCHVACPCIFGSDPTFGECTAILAWHVDRGSSGRHSLAGLNFVIAVYCSGNMETHPWEVAIYLDSRAAGPQREALEAILTGKAGGLFRNLSSVFQPIRGIRSVPIEFEVDGKKRTLRVSGVTDVVVERLPTGKGL